MVRHPAPYVRRQGLHAVLERRLRGVLAVESFFDARILTQLRDPELTGVSRKLALLLVLQW
jgi:hypothetical protein